MPNNKAETREELSESEKPFVCFCRRHSCPTLFATPT